MAERGAPWAPAIERADDPAAAAGAALAEALLASLAERGAIRLAIPGGSALAAVPPARERLGAEWRRVVLTWTDERCVPVSAPESNRGAARRLGLLDDPAPGDCLPLYEDGEPPEAAVARVAAALHERFAGGLDVLLLGMGEDGHVASLFPSRVWPAEGPVAHVPDSPKPPAHRITLTRGLLATARRSVLLAAGETKRPALERLVAGDERLPACGLPGLRIVTDLAIARPSGSGSGATDAGGSSP